MLQARRVTMLQLAHAGLTTPAVAGPGCNEGLGRTESTSDFLAGEHAGLTAPDNGALPVSQKRVRQSPDTERLLQRLLAAYAKGVVDLNLR